MVRRVLRRIAASAAGASVLVMLAAGLATAHPLGNFTINHYAGLRVGPRSASLDVVIDMAEIPAFQERQQLDRNGDGSVDSAEADAARGPLCQTLAGSLRLTDGSARLPLSLEEAGLSFPPGSSGLDTLRLVCEFDTQLAGPGSREIAFADNSYAGRIGWREIVVTGDGATIAPAAGSSSPLGASVSGRLTHYPADLLAAPLAMRSTSFETSPGGPTLAPATIPDAWPLGAGIAAGAPGPAGAVPAGGAATQGAAGTRGADAHRTGEAAASIAGAVPGGIGDSLTGMLEVRDLTPPVLLLSLGAALVLGAAHALSPGHGKTVMAAYLVGTRGTAAQAAALGLVVTVSHTLGVFALALVVLGASNVVAPERLYPLLSVGAGLIVVAIGLYLVAARVRAWQAARGGPSGVQADGAEHDHGRVDAHEDEHDREHSHEHAHQPGHEAGGERAHSHPHPHEHGVGPFRHAHSHAAEPNLGTGSLRWRSLAMLGLAGGLVPSASALLLLLGALAAGRAAYGLVLVVAFGLGMAAVLVGIGLGLVYAGRLVERIDLGARGRRAVRLVPAATAAAVLAGGVVLTYQALHQVL